MRLETNRQDSEMLSHNQAAILVKLSTELDSFDRHRFIQTHSSLQGLAFGLGPVVGAKALLSVLVN